MSHTDDDPSGVIRVRRAGRPGPRLDDGGRCDGHAGIRIGRTDRFLRRDVVRLTMRAVIPFLTEPGTAKHKDDMSIRVKGMCR